MKIQLDMYSKGFYFAIRKHGDENLLFVRAITFDREAESEIGKLVMYTSEQENQPHRMGNVVLLSPLTTQSQFVKFFPEGKKDILQKIDNGEINTKDLKFIFPDVLMQHQKAIEEILEDIE